MSAAPELTAPPPDALWTGAPAARPTREDGLAGLLAFALTAVVLGGGLSALHGLPPARAAQLGLAYAALVAATTVAARVAGAGALTTLLGAFIVAVGAAALMTRSSGAAVFCPLTSAALVVWLLTLRLRQQRATRYWISPTRVGMGEVGRYVVVFPRAAPPAVCPDRFGAGLGDLDFGTGEARLTTRKGATLVIAARRCRLRRVREPARVVELTAGPPTAAPTGAGPAP